MKGLIKGICRTLGLIIIYALGLTTAAQGQVPVTIANHVDQHIFSFNEIQFLEDQSGKLTFDQVRSKTFARAFRPSETSTPQTRNLDSYYWFRIRIRGSEQQKNSYILEFFDQTIDEIEAYLPDPDGNYSTKTLGDHHPFAQREFQHKNFELKLPRELKGEYIYYFRIKSSQPADVIIVLRSINWFVHYALDEYLTFGIFYGMILVFSFYNLLMWIAMRQRQYLYYVLYILSIGLYEMSTDGIAYQYLWPEAIIWNQYAYALALCAISVFALLFTRDLLYVKAKAPRLNELIIATISGRIIFFLLSLAFFRDWLTYKFIEFIPLTIAFYTGIYIFRQGYRPARFFVLAYGFLFAGFTLKLLILVTNGWLNFGILSYYSLSLCFIVEMVLLSFAIGDKVSLLKKKKDKVQRSIIRQMKENERLKDLLTQELESQVNERTRELVDKARIIEEQNEELKSVNELLKQQAEEISRMNVLLEQDNQQLNTDIRTVTRARVLSADVDFSEFSKIYPDQETCYRFLAELKWEKGYQCRKCDSDQYYHGHLPYSRRCRKCGYEESVTANTILQNTRIPINKAFYMIFLVYSTKGKISSHKLADILSIRQSTCWSYGSKVKKLMEERKKELKDAGEKGWSKLVLD